MNSAVISVLATGGSRVISFVKNIVIAHIISPDEFGAFVAVVALFGLIEISGGNGIKDYLIVVPDLRSRLVHVLWTFHAIKGLVQSCILIVIVWTVQQLHPLSIFTIALVMSLSPAIKGFMSLGPVLCQRNMSVSSMSLLVFCGQLVDAVVSVICCYRLQTGIGLAIGVLSGLTAQLFVSYLVTDYYPRVIIDRELIMPMMHFGKWRVVSGIAWYLSTSGDDLLVGAIAGNRSLGIYRNGWNLANAPLSIMTGALEAITLPFFANDVRKLNSAWTDTYLAYVRLTMYIITPVASVFVVWSHQIVQLLLGTAWNDAAIPLSILAISSIFRGGSATSGPLYLAHGLPKIESYFQIWRACSLFALLVMLVPIFGVTGAAFASLGSIFVVSVYWHVTVNRLGVAWRSLFCVNVASVTLLGIYTGPMLAIKYFCHSLSMEVVFSACWGMCVLVCSVLHVRTTLNAINTKPSRQLPQGGILGDSEASS